MCREWAAGVAGVEGEHRPEPVRGRGVLGARADSSWRRGLEDEGGAGPNRVAHLALLGPRGRRSRFMPAPLRRHRATATNNSVGRNARAVCPIIRYLLAIQWISAGVGKRSPRARSECAVRPACQAAPGHAQRETACRRHARHAPVTERHGAACPGMHPARDGTGRHAPACPGMHPARSGMQPACARHGAAVCRRGVRCVSDATARPVVRRVR
jgi:hypothetical protein